MRQLTFARTCCGSAFGAWPPLISVTTQVVRNMPFQPGFTAHSRSAAASSGGFSAPRAYRRRFPAAPVFACASK
jgi:hypothetical protein